MPGRVLLCTQCASPVQGPPYGGLVPCSGCGCPNALPPRDDSPPGYSAAAQMPESVRIEHLRQQDGRPLPSPPSLQALLEGGALPPWKVSEAVAVWQSSRREAATTHSHDAAERVFFLTLLLANLWTEQSDFGRVRGVFESALDVLPLPRQKQMMRGALCRLAVRAGNLAEAEQWLAACDPRSDDLQSDSAWRLARAMVDTARGDFAAVLGVLGGRFVDVPVLDAMDPIAAVLRANAWERQGQPEAAVAALVEYFGRGGASGRSSVRKTVEAYPALHLCAATLVQAEQLYSARAAAAAVQRDTGGIHKVFVPLGAALVLAAVGASVAGWLGQRGVLDVSADLVAVVSPMGVLGAVFLVTGLVLARSAKRATYLRTQGLQGRGRITGVEATGVHINNVPQVRVLLEVTVPGHPPYATSTKVLMNQSLLPYLQVGAAVAVRANPQNVRDVLLETD